jgi:hypothetical protein
MTMAENTPEQGQAAATPPADHRPQPRYGELAPEGWTWTPPQEATPPAASAPVSTPVNTPVNTAPAAQRSVIRPGTAARGTAVPGNAPGWDRPLSAILLALGLVGSFIIISMLATLPEAIQVLYTQADLGTYVPAASVAAVITAGSVGQVVIWLATAVTSILLMIKNRRSFYVSLIGGVVSFVLLVAAMAFVLAGDTALIEYFSQP